MIKHIELEYIDKGTFQGSEENFCTAGFESQETFVAVKASEYTAIIKALQKIAEFENEPIWNDDRDASANLMVYIARSALVGVYDYES